MRDTTGISVIHDLHVEVGGRTAQIDHLVISRYRLAYVLETKNLNADLQCNERGEWTAWYGPHRRGTPTPIPSPIEQARRHVDVLRWWLKQRGWTTLRRIDPVVVVSPTTFVGKTRAKGDEAVAIVRSDLFTRWWENDRDIGHALTAPWLMATRYSTEQLAELGAMLVADHHPLARNWAAQFGLPSPPAAKIGTVSDHVGPPIEAPPSHAVDARLGNPRASSRRTVDSTSEIVTPFGIVTVLRVSDWRYALRHGSDAGLAEHVGRIGRQRGEWQPRFKNWLVSADNLDAVVRYLRADNS